MDNECQLFSTTFLGKLKNLDSTHRDCIRIYTGAFRTSPVALLHVEEYHSPLKLKRNILGLKFLYKLRSKITYTESLNTFDDRENQNYEESNEAAKPKGANLRKLE